MSHPAGNVLVAHISGYRVIIQRGLGCAANGPGYGAPGRQWWTYHKNGRSVRDRNQTPPAVSIHCLMNT